VYELGVKVLTERCCYSNVFEEKSVLAHCRPEKKKFFLSPNQQWEITSVPLLCKRDNLN